jgi:glycosyltransferase involved in cell wall biosynthesis
MAQASGDMFERELASIFRCDTALLVSEVERDILQHWCQVPSHQLFVNQLCYQTLTDSVPNIQEFSQRQNFYFIGNFKHTPNLDAVHWLKQILWPRIRQELLVLGIEADLHVYGASSETQAHRVLHDPKGGFHLKGHGTDIRFRSYRVNLAPLRFGAGIKGKIAEGWSYGIPAITTPVGAEGMHGNLPFGGQVVSTTAEFVAAAVKTYTERESWVQHSQAGLEVIQTRFSPKDHRLGFQNHIRECLDKKPTLRQNNFMGRILNHQSMRATEYFSRWIQLKQKLQAL